MPPPPVAHANGNATLDRTYDTGGPIPDAETGAFRAALRAKMAMDAHLVSEDVVTAREVGEQLAFAVKESLAVAAAEFDFPAAIPPALIAALANLNNTLIQVIEQGEDVKGHLIELKKKVDDVQGQMKEQGDDVKGQLIQLKKQVDDVKDQLIIAEHRLFGHTQQQFQTVADVFGEVHRQLGQDSDSDIIGGELAAHHDGSHY